MAVHRMLPIVAALAILSLATMLCGNARAGEVVAGDLKIEALRVNPSIGTAPNSVAYLKITNAGSAPDRLVSVSSGVAKRAMLHTTRMENGIMKMRHLKDGVGVPAGGEAELKPGGDHVMLMGLTRKLAVGDMVHMELEFEKQGKVPVMATVVKLGATGGGHGHHGKRGHGQ